MNKGPLLFLGIFVSVAISWAGVVFTSATQQASAGADRPYYDSTSDLVLPVPMSGIARQGSRVYQDLGCAACHTQQVRNRITGPGDAPSPDVARGWGDRPSVARDYVHEDRVMLGSMRIGPDLRNVGQRRPDPNWHYLHLYNPRITTPPSEPGESGSIMPPMPFLFEVRPIADRQPSKRALDLPPEFAPPPGYEVVPTSRAEALVAYLLSLRTEQGNLPEVGQ